MDHRVPEGQAGRRWRRRVPAQCNWLTEAASWAAQFRGKPAPKTSAIPGTGIALNRPRAVHHNARMNILVRTASPAAHG